MFLPTTLACASHLPFSDLEIMACINQLKLWTGPPEKKGVLLARVAAWGFDRLGVTHAIVGAIDRQYNGDSLNVEARLYAGLVELRSGKVLVFWNTKTESSALPLPIPIALTFLCESLFDL